MRNLKEQNPNPNVIEVDSTTPDFERASHIFSQAIGVNIDEECVRMLWATCFVPRQAIPRNGNITGRELVVHTNPAEISDLTDNLQGTLSRAHNATVCVGNQTNSENERRQQLETVNRVGYETNRNNNTEPGNVIINTSRGQSTNDANEQLTNIPIPLGVAGYVDNEQHCEENEDHQSVHSESTGDLSPPLFEESGNVGKSNTLWDSGENTERDGSSEQKQTGTENTTANGGKKDKPTPNVEEEVSVRTTNGGKKDKPTPNVEEEVSEGTTVESNNNCQPPTTEDGPRENTSQNDELVTQLEESTNVDLCEKTCDDQQGQTTSAKETVTKNGSSNQQDMSSSSVHHPSRDGAEKETVAKVRELGWWLSLQLYTFETNLCMNE